MLHLQLTEIIVSEETTEEAKAFNHYVCTNNNNIIEIYK